MWAVQSRCLMMPFVCFLGNSLSNLLDSVKACQRVWPHKNPLISYFICGQPNRSSSSLHLLHTPFPGTPPKKDRPTLSFLLSNQDYLDQAISCGEWGTGQMLLSVSKSIEISQDLDVSNWDFMAYFLRDPKACFVLLWAVFPQGSRWKKLFSSFICFFFLLL